MNMLSRFTAKLLTVATISFSTNVTWALGEAKPQAALYLSDHDITMIDKIEQYLLMAIIATGTILFLVLLMLLLRFMSQKQKAKIQRFPISRKNTVLDPAGFFGVPIDEEIADMFQIESVDFREESSAPIIRGIIQQDENIIANLGLEQALNESCESEVSLESCGEDVEIAGSSELDLPLHAASFAAVPPLEIRNEPTIGLSNQLLISASIMKAARQDSNTGFQPNSPSSLQPSNSPFAIKIALAKSYLSIDDKENARSLLEDTVLMGSAAEKMAAEQLLASL